MGPCWSLRGPSCPLSPGTLVPGGQGWGRKQGGWLLCGAESSWLSSGARQTSQNSVSLGNPRSFPNQRIGSRWFLALLRYACALPVLALG